MPEHSWKTEQDKAERRTVRCSEMDKLTADKIWRAMMELENHPFTTAKGLEFRYTVKRHNGIPGNEIFVDRKTKSITRSSMEIALNKALELGGGTIPAAVKGPKQLGVFGASYLYPVFQELGIIQK